MDERRNRVAWLIALGLVTALASVPSVLAALEGEPTHTVVAADRSSAIVPLSGIAGVVGAAPEAVRTFLSGLLR
jgi:hypothetical protein